VLIIGFPSIITFSFGFGYQLKVAMEHISDEWQERVKSLLERVG